MPLSEKARIEVYVPDIPKAAYRDLLSAFDREFCRAFGGATVLRRVDGSFLSRQGKIVHDRIKIIYTDTPFTMSEHLDLITRYADKLKHAVLDALNEEAVLVVVIPVFHAN